MTCKPHATPLDLDLAIREAVHKDILECVEDYLAARQHRTINDHVGPLVERIIAEAFGADKNDDLCDECGVVDFEHKQSCPHYVSGESVVAEVDAAVLANARAVCARYCRSDEDHTGFCTLDAELARAAQASADAKIDALIEGLDVAERQSLFRRPRLWKEVDLPEAPSESEDDR